MRNQIFISYSHKDARYLDMLRIGLKPLIRGNNISVWDDKQIKPGEDWKREIEKALASAKIAVLLVSTDFLASDFIYQNELPPLLEAAENDGLTILWIAVRHSGYKDTEIGRYQAVNEPLEPLDSLSKAEREKELVRICDIIKSAFLIEASKVAKVAEERTRVDEEEHAQSGPRVVLLYKRNAQPDEQVLKLLKAELSANGYSVFIDRHLKIGVEWAKEIPRQISSAYAVVPLLSAHSVTSEIFSYEIEIANEAALKQGGEPHLLPIRVNFEDRLPDPIGSILNPIQYALWSSPDDNKPLVSNLLESLKTPPRLKEDAPQTLAPPTGVISPDSIYYIERPTDKKFLDAIKRRDSIVLVKGARQMGKTSLLARGLQKARKDGAEVVITDFQKLSATGLETIDSLYKALGDLIADQLDLDVSPDDVWKPKRDPNINFERYIKREVLNNISKPLVWGMDEVDRLFSCDYGNNVFALFRTWHNERGNDPEGPWKNLTLAIVYATEAHLFISDLNQSPFNVGTKLKLADFNFDQVAKLNDIYDTPRPLQGMAEVTRFFRLVGGHPYLVRRGLHEIQSQHISLPSFEALADSDEGPFSDHLRRMLVLLARYPDLCEEVRKVLHGEPCLSDEHFYRLRSAGILSGDSRLNATMRCQLYANYLERHIF